MERYSCVAPTLADASLLCPLGLASQHILMNNRNTGIRLLINMHNMVYTVITKQNIP